jgi:hypothetical protein
MVVNRRQFRSIFNEFLPGLGESSSALWIPEQDNGRQKSRWFVCIRPLSFTDIQEKKQFWVWCQQNCRGQILCYSSDTDNHQEWWGFTHYADIAWWMLRWA